MAKFAFVLFFSLLAVWRIKRGFRNGILKEIVTILSGAVSLVCVVLLFLAVSSVIAKATSTLVVCIVALVILGIAFKICNLIFSPLLAIGNISVIGGLNKILGAVLGFGEACAIAFLLYKILDYFNIYLF